MIENGRLKLLTFAHDHRYGTDSGVIVTRGSVDVWDLAFTDPSRFEIWREDEYLAIQDAESHTLAPLLRFVEQRANVGDPEAQSIVENLIACTLVPPARATMDGHQRAGRGFRIVSGSLDSGDFAGGRAVFTEDGSMALLETAKDGPDAIRYGGPVYAALKNEHMQSAGIVLGESLPQTI